MNEDILKRKRFTININTFESMSLRRAVMNRSKLIK